MVRTTRQRKHTDEDVIVGDQCFRIPRKINDNIETGSEEGQGLKTLERVGINLSGFGSGLDLRVPPVQGPGRIEVKKNLSLKANDIDMEVPHKAPVKGVSHGDDKEKASGMLPKKPAVKSPPKAKSG